MISTTTTAAIRFTPDFMQDQPDAPVFLLRAGSVMERAEIEAELAGRHRAADVYGFEWRQVFREGAAKIFAGEPELDHVLELEALEAERVIAAVKSGGTVEPLPDEDRRLLTVVRGILAEHWPEFQALVERNERRRKFAPILAFRRFCVGWENVNADYRRGVDGLIAEASLAAIDSYLLLFAGNQAFSMLYGGGQEKNSPPPSKSDEGGPISSSDAS